MSIGSSGADAPKGPLTMHGTADDPQAIMTARTRSWRTAMSALLALALASGLMAASACSDGADHGVGVARATATPVVAGATATPVVATATATPVVATATATPVVASATATPVVATATATPVVATATATPVVDAEQVSAALTGQVMQLLLEAMSDPASELFSGSLDAFPPELRALLAELGVDIFLGVVSVDAGDGVVVVAVFPDSPAARAGVAVGDLIAAIDGVPVRGAALLRADVEAVAESASLTLTIDRSGVQRMIEVVREPASAGNVWRGGMLRSLALLLALQDVPGGPDVPSSLLGEMTEETVDGLRVFAVFPGSPADNGGIRPGDLLISIDGRVITALADLDALMRSFTPAAGSVEVVLLRDGVELTLSIKLPAGGLAGGAATQ